jgi:hypothetical protein
MSRIVVSDFSLKDFVTRELRRYSHIQAFIFDREAFGDDEDFIEGIKMMTYFTEKRIVVILGDEQGADDTISALVSSGVLNIVTTMEYPVVRDEISECLSAEGMSRYKAGRLSQLPQQETTAPIKEEQYFRKYSFSEKGRKIAVCASSERLDTATTALNLACYVAAHGGEACYVEDNDSGRLAALLSIYEAEEKLLYTGGKSYTFSDISLTCYDREAAAGMSAWSVEEDYNIIVCDGGTVKRGGFSDTLIGADVRVMVVGTHPWDIEDAGKAADAMSTLPYTPLYLGGEPDMVDMAKDICGDGHMLPHSSLLFNGESGARVFESLLSKYIESYEDVLIAGDVGEDSDDKTSEEDSL